MNKKNIIISVVIALVFAGGGFFGGYKYAQAKRPSLATFRNANGGNFFVGNVAGARRGGANGESGSFTAGQISAKDDKSITIKTMDGGSKIVYFSDSTQIAKSAQGTSADLTNEENVVVTGTANSDGSVTAQMIQIRPIMPTPAPAAQ